MSHGPTRQQRVATSAPQNAEEGSSPLESVDTKGNQRTVDVPNQEIFIQVLEQLEALNTTMSLIAQYLEQLTSNDLRQAISKSRFTMNHQETEHGRN